MKNFTNFSRYTIFWITYAMHATSVFPCIITKISIFTTFFYFSNIYFQILLDKYNRFLHFHMISVALLLIASFFFFLKLIIFMTCSLKNSQNLSMQSLPLYTSSLFSMLWNDHIVDIEKTDGIYLLTFVVDKFSGLFLHPLFLFIIYSSSA